jgi:predicted DsbA family dithiol-disulfide isomerase
MIKLDIMSDPICPWCYIGKTHLEKALAEHPDHPFTVEWHPFQLNPDMPAEGMDRRVYLERKFGGKAEAIKVYSQIEQTAASLGLPIDFAAMKRTPNTIDAHRLIHWAGLERWWMRCFKPIFAWASTSVTARLYATLPRRLVWTEMSSPGFSPVTPTAR